MKNLVIILGTIVLGVCIFNMMIGDDESSMKSVSQQAMHKTLEIYNTQEDY